MFTDHKKFAAAPAAPAGVSAEEKQALLDDWMQDGCPYPIDNNPVSPGTPVIHGACSAAKSDAPVVYGLPTKPKDGPARVVFDEHYCMLVIHGVLVLKGYRAPIRTLQYERLRDEINAAAKRGAA